MNILFETRFGSHLYGTSTPESDLDFKGVYIATLEDIIFKKDKETIEIKTGSDSRKNTSSDVDKTYVELRRFIKDALSGQTYALDMLFSNKENLIHTSDVWKELIENRDKFLSKNVEPFIGYCRQQAGKYGLKGSRLDTLLRCIEFLDSRQYRAGTNEKLRFTDIQHEFKESEFAKIVMTKGTDAKGALAEYENLQVLEKKFSVKMFVKDILQPLRKLDEKYGSRARDAMHNKGVDWKAISHAYRCCYQLEELATTGKITFPLKEAKKLLEIKKGLISWDDVQKELPVLMKKSIKSVRTGVLPEQPDREFWNKFISKTYLNNA